MSQYEGNGDSEAILDAAVRQMQLWYEKRLTLDECADNIRNENKPHARSVISILFEFFRHKEFLENLLMQTASKGSTKPFLKYVALCALTQSLFQTSIASQSAVNIAVTYVKKSKFRAGAGFMNAVLRNALKNAGEPPYPAGLPQNIAQKWRKNFPDDFEKLVAVHASCVPDMTFRFRGTGLPAENFPVCREIPSFFHRFRFYASEDGNGILQSIPFAEGKIYVQDPATSLGISFCEGLVRGNVMDACACPGGKTVMLADLASPDAVITACDKSAHRLEPMKKNLERLSLSSRIVLKQMDALEPVACGMRKNSFDLVFADVPCSNTGVARRRPDALCRFDNVRLSEVVQLQKAILDSLSELVAENGFLLYSTCSIEPEEDEIQIRNFLQKHPFFTRVREQKLLPDENHDGAFASLLRKGRFCQKC